MSRIIDTIKINDTEASILGATYNKDNGGIAFQGGRTTGEKAFATSGCTAGGDYSHAEGYNTKTATEFEFKILSKGETSQPDREEYHTVLYLDSVKGLTIGYYVIFDTDTNVLNDIQDYLFINHVDPNNKSITVVGQGQDAWQVSIADFSTLSKKFLYIKDHPELGSVARNGAPYAHAEGYETISEGTASHAEGFETEATGDYAHAEGYQTISEDIATHAEGYGTQATGIYSHTEGCETATNGEASHAEGQETTAGGTASHAEGYGTNANSNYSHAEGQSTFTDGDASHAEGYLTKANGNHSHAEGDQTNANGDSSHAEGCNTYAIGEGAHAEGDLTKAIGFYSHAEGDETKTYGLASHAEGSGTTAYGDDAHAEGANTKAGGEASHTEGYNTKTATEFQYQILNKGEIIGPEDGYQGNYYITLYLNSIQGLSKGYEITFNTSNDYLNDSRSSINEINENNNSIIIYSQDQDGDTIKNTDFSTLTKAYLYIYNNPELGSVARNGASYAHAEGNSTQALGEASHAEGKDTKATGNYSHAEGNGTTASGSNSHASGTGTIASRDSQTVVGKYNQEVSDALFIVGNGESEEPDDRKNAFVVKQNGNINLFGYLILQEGIHYGETPPDDLPDGALWFQVVKTNE